MVESLNHQSKPLTHIAKQPLKPNFQVSPPTSSVNLRGSLTRRARVLICQTPTVRDQLSNLPQ
ncbi:hypothetical protein LINPERHAP1_LOCUS34346, partial [Linum perenne]